MSGKKGHLAVHTQIDQTSKAGNSESAAATSDGLGITAPCEECVVVALVGDSDMTTARELRSVIEQQAQAGDGIVVSVTETQFIDSAIVHELFRGDRAMLNVGRRLVLHSDADAIVERVLEIGGVLGELLWTVTLHEAIE